MPSLPPGLARLAPTLANTRPHGQAPPARAFPLRMPPEIRLTIVRMAQEKGGCIEIKQID
jgi:hypothetical protein